MLGLKNIYLCRFDEVVFKRFTYSKRVKVRFPSYMNKSLKCKEVLFGMAQTSFESSRLKVVVY